MGKPFFGAIADDFAGAADLASMLARGGAGATLRIGVPSGPAECACEVVALDLRMASTGDAVAAAGDALRWLRAEGIERFYWAYGSGFEGGTRGTIGAVADACMSAIGTELTLHCPAFPENGRRVFMSHLFVGEEALADSAPSGEEPPARDSHLPRLLAAQGRRPVGRVAFPVVRAGADAVRDALAGTAGHVVADAIESVDLDVLAEAVQDLPLICGGPALAAALPGAWRGAGRDLSRPGGEAPEFARPGRLVLAGSCAGPTRQQIGAYLDRALGYRLDPVELAQDGLGPACAWLARQDPEADKVIYSSAEPNAVAAARTALGAGRASALVGEALGRLAVEAREMGIGAVVVAGGDARDAVFRALGVGCLRIGPEIAPGVPWCFAEDGLALAYKAGDFGGRGILAECFEVLACGGVLAAQ